MGFFKYLNNELYAENISISTIATRYGTPVYVYSENYIRKLANSFKREFGKRNNKICFAVKSCPNLYILRLLSQLGCYFDVVSEGELHRVLIATGTISNSIFSGVGKSYQALEFAIRNNIHCINVESEEELLRIISITNTINTPARISLRVNPDIDAKSHPYISTGLEENKFGISLSKIKECYQIAAQSNHLEISGISCHIGSQINDLDVFKEAAKKITTLCEELYKSLNLRFKFVDMGGGLGIDYTSDSMPKIQSYINNLVQALPEDIAPQIYIEPGRALIGKCGILVTKVEYLKENGDNLFVIVDAGMNDLARPSLYGASHRIDPAIKKDTGNNHKSCQIVGPVCETSDTFTKSYKYASKTNDIIAIRDVGAYGSSMASNYNSRLLAPEILISGDKATIIRERQTISHMLKQEVACLSQNEAIIERD